MLIWVHLIEGLTKYYGCCILISEYTYEHIKDRILCRPIDIVQVKGKRDGIKVYEPLCLIEQETSDLRQTATLTEQGFKHYQEANGS